LVAASRGADLRIVGLSAPDRAAAVLVLPDSGLKTAEDLRGKRLSAPRRLNDTIDWWRATVLGGYADLMAAAGMSMADVRLVDVDIDRAYMEDATSGQAQGQSLWGARSQFAVQREEIAALLRGEVDAIYSDGAMYALVQAFLGLQPIAGPAGADPDGHPLILTVSGALLDSRPDLVRRWLSRLLDARAWALSHPELARRIIAADTGLPEDFVEAAYSPAIYGQLDITLDPPALQFLKHRHDQLVAGGFIDQALDIDALIAAEPLREAADLHADA
jgi:ABC-type nitrate/sulfonate/bicarbonate transport system substrate-binding protein